MKTEPLIRVRPKFRPVLHPEFVPAVLWNRAYREAVGENGRGSDLAVAVERGDGTVSVVHTRILPHEGEAVAANQLYVERLVKFLLWQRGGYKVIVAGNFELGAFIAGMYSAQGKRAFDHQIMGERIYSRPMTVQSVPLDKAPEENEISRALGGHLDGCRVGFDLGGSDRKCAALIEGEVVHSEEVVWDPYFKEDPQWHLKEINDSLERAAAKLPRVDAIGGSAAGVYVNNEVRVASIFRGVPPELFEGRVRPLFLELQKKWGNVPFVVANDGDVTALAGAMSIKDNAVLGVAMGTSLAAGYVNSRGHITNWLNELAFAPVDFHPQAPVDEWSGDGGVGAQYFSQQAVGRLVPVAGIELPSEMPLPEKLIEVQKLVEAGADRAPKIYETIGVYLGYAVALYAEFYEVRHLLVLGRVLSGAGGELIVATARQVLLGEFPEVAEKVRLHMPGEQEKRLGQAVAAATLPGL
ncbi:MAG: ROK family protein [Acidobacteriota bacterium]